MQNVTRRYEGQMWRSRVALFSMMLPLAVWGGSFFTSITPTLRLIYIVLGFSLIIFLHELGHFVVARLCSVKCLAFSIGIGPRMCGWRKHGGFSFGADPYDPDANKNKGQKSETTAVQSDLPTTSHEPPHPRNVGDTDYRISWLPLGGYVRMLGQDDMDPTKISDDPHSFNRRPIWQRMCIVSAGVIMNIIFAAVTFSIIFSPGIGVDFPPAVIGAVYYNMPAYGELHMGDQILSINGQRPRGFVEFTDLKMEAALADGVDPMMLHVRPAGTHGEADRDVKILPKRNDLDGFLAIGVESIPGLKIADEGKDYRDADYEKLMKRVDLSFSSNESAYGSLRKGDRIVKIDEIPLPETDWHQNPNVTFPYVTLYQHVQEGNGKAVKLTLQNTLDKSSATREITLIPHLEHIAGSRDFPQVLGLAPRTVVDEIDKKHAAYPGPAKGIKEGDRIVRVGERTYPTAEQLIEIVQSHPDQPLDIAVERDGPNGQVVSETYTDVKPRNEKGKGVVGLPLSQDIARTYFIPPAPDTAIGGLNLPREAKISAIDGQAVSNWPEIYAQLRAHKTGETVKVTFDRGNGENASAQVAMSAADDKAVHELLHYQLGLHLELETRTQVAANAGEAVLMGMDHTKKFILNVYMTLAGLFRGTVSPDNLHGIVGITKVGYDVQERGPVWLWYVLAMVSVNLAVANFLPLPIVDGGLFLLLILEKIRGKPLSLKVQTAIQAVGIVLLAGLFLFVTYNDIGMFWK